MIVHLGLPRRPEPRDAKAQLVLDWADVGFYIFRLVLTAVVLVLVIVLFGPTILELL